MTQYFKLHATKFGLAAGIIGAIVTFLTTILGIYGNSKAAETMMLTMWGSLGYSVSWLGAFIGIIIGFVYAFIIMWVAALIYNKLIS
jgi:hypothetical protein